MRSIGVKFLKGLVAIGMSNNFETGTPNDPHMILNTTLS